MGEYSKQHNISGQEFDAERILADALWTVNLTDIPTKTEDTTDLPPPSGSPVLDLPPPDTADNRLLNAAEQDFVRHIQGK